MERNAQTFLDVVDSHKGIIYKISRAYCRKEADRQDLVQEILLQLILIYQVDVGEPVIDTQENLARLKSSTLWVTRLLFLQLPVWTTFYINADMIKNGGVVFFLVQVPVSLAFFFIAIWLFINIKYKNRDKKWFRLIFSGREWDPVIQSMELLDQVREYRESEGVTWFRSNRNTPSLRT